MYYERQALKKWKLHESAGMIYSTVYSPVLAKKAGSVIAKIWWQPKEHNAVNLNIRMKSNAKKIWCGWVKNVQNNTMKLK
jgi:7-keto-8-aminopelargonate synthetase-like enzyme